MSENHICTCGDCSPDFADQCQFEKALEIATETLEKYARLPGPTGAFAQDALSAISTLNASRTSD